MAEVNVPGIGGVDKKYVIIGGAVVAGIVGYAWWNAGSSGEGEEELPPVDQGDVGIPPSDGYVNPAPGGSTVTGDPPDPETMPPTTNAEWSRRAVDRLEAVGYDPAVVLAAVGKYLGRQQLTTAQADIIRQALALVGPVPQGEYHIILAPTGPVTPTRPPTTTLPAPLPNKPPASAPKPPATSKRYPTRWKSVIVRPGDNYSKIATRYGLRMSGTDLLNYQFSSQAKRPESTKAALRARKPRDKIFAGGTVVLPYPK